MLCEPRGGYNHLHSILVIVRFAIYYPRIDFTISYFGSCVLQASAVKCRSIPSIHVLDWHSIDTQLILKRYSNDTPSTLDRQSTVATKFWLMHMSIIGCCKFVSVKNSFKRKCQERNSYKEENKEKNSCRRKVQLWLLFNILKIILIQNILGALPQALLYYY